jgi:hypothetical protein
MEAIPEQILNSRGLSQEVTSSLTYETKGDDRLMTVILKTVEELKNKVHQLETKKIIDETQLPTEILEQNNLLPPRPKKLKRGRGYRPLLQSEIEEAKLKSPFAAQQARYLNVASSTYRKYAKLYGIYEPKPNEKGKRNLYDPNKGKYPINEVLNGQHPDVSDWVVKDKLIRGKILPPECAICGYNKRRIVDNKICLLIDHKDGDRKNFKKENLQLLCFNCTFECGRGYIHRGNHMFDADWMQGAKKDDIDERSRW